MSGFDLKSLLLYRTEKRSKAVLRTPRLHQLSSLRIRWIESILFSSDVFLCEVQNVWRFLQHHLLWRASHDKLWTARPCSKPPACWRVIRWGTTAWLKYTKCRKNSKTCTSISTRFTAISVKWKITVTRNLMWLIVTGVWSTSRRPYVTLIDRVSALQFRIYFSDVQKSV